MFCCSGKKIPTKDGQKINESLNLAKLDWKLENKTVANQDHDVHEEPLPKKELNKFQTYEVEQESNSAVKCPSLIVSTTPFQLYLQKLISPEEAYNFQDLPKDRLVIQLQDEASLIIDCPVIQEQSLREDFIPDKPEEDEQAQNSDDADDNEELNDADADKAAIFKWAKEPHDYCSDKKVEQIMQRVQQFVPIKSKEESRFSQAHDSGGKVCKNKKLVQTLRSIGKQLIKQIGRQILSGNLNLTTISFPIRAMIPKSALEKVLLSSCLFPLYMNRACIVNDPVERLKLLICATLGNFYINCSFLKPLNPIIGETISGRYADGTQCYVEQISHHPPVSYFLTLGPNDSYRFYGYYNYEASAGLNSLSLKNKGKRYMQFKNQRIEYNFAGEEYSGSFWGPMKVESKGKMSFEDKLNQITAVVEFDSVRWKATDYLSGEIKCKGKRVCKIYGSYMGFIEFGDQRYWDVNYIKPYECTVDKPSALLQSDASFRQDLRALKKSKVEQAQIEKDQIEMQQRNDGKLRKNRRDHI